MFDFIIIVCLDGMEIIDRTKRISCDMLTPFETVSYIETEIQLAILDRMKGDNNR